MVTTIGFQLSSIAPYLQSSESIQASFHKISEIGYRYVQLQGIPMEIPDATIVTALESSGLTCVATQEDYVLGFGDDPDRAIRRAVAVGARFLSCALIPKELDTPSKLDEFAQSLSVIANDVHDAGLVFAFHPISYDYRRMEGQLVVDRLMDALPDHVQLTFCVAAAHSAGIDPDLVFDRYSGRMDLVHFKDDALQPDGSRHMMPLGQGSHDWAQVLQSCNAAGVKYVFAEQEQWLKDVFECAADSLAYLASFS